MIMTTAHITKMTLTMTMTTVMIMIMTAITGAGGLVATSC